MGFLSNMFGSKAKDIGTKAPQNGEIPADFQPTKGTFMRTREYPEHGADGEIIGKIWLEGGYSEERKAWVLWQKAIRDMSDMATGGTTNGMMVKALSDKTTFVNVYDQMFTFELSQKSLGLDPLPGKTAAKLGGDHFRQFAWREGLMNSRSGRLYPVQAMSADSVNADNFFDVQDITDAKAFLDRIKSEQFTMVPLILPSTDWAKAYAAAKDKTDQRLNALYHRYGNDKNSPELAVQVFGHETSEVIYAHLQRGFDPKLIEADAKNHFALLKAAIDRQSVDALSMLSEEGLSFAVRYKDETPLELVLQQRRYSHLYVMLSRDGEKLANYTDESGNSAASMAVTLQDPQAFRMLYLEGLDYNHVDQNGWAFVHHAFKSGFMPGIYAWIDEGHSIDAPIAGTQFTGLSLAKAQGNTIVVDFAIKHGANPDAPVYGQKPVAAPVATPAPEAPEFSIALLNSAATNDEIKSIAQAHANAGGSFNLLSDKGVSLFETCWKNQKAAKEFDRRALIPFLGGLGADPAAQLDDGTTDLTRAVSGKALDMNYIKAIAPYAKDVSAGDAQGNNVLHTLQMNPTELVASSTNISAMMKLFPTLDINAQNAQGYSNVGLAIRLNRAQTLKVFANLPADLGQTTQGNWSLLDIAFTGAAALEGVNGAPRADKITATNDNTRTAVLDMVDRTMTGTDAEKKQKLSDAFNRTRPDQRTLGQALASENAPAQTVQRLAARGMKT